MQTKHKEYLLFDSWIDADPIETLVMQEMTPKRFYSEFVSKSKPFLLKDGASSWKAMDNWN